MLEKNAGTKLAYVKLQDRESDQRVFVADLSKVERLLSWHPNVSSCDGVKLMYEWVGSHCEAAGVPGLNQSYAS